MRCEVTILFRGEPTVLEIDAENFFQARRIIQRQLDNLGEGGYVVKVEALKEPQH
jgi:hypothetical protein